jgi:hypothetical protein
VFPVALLGRAVPVLQTDDGLRAAGKDQKPVRSETVEKYLVSKFGEALAEDGFRLYEAFRPGIPSGESGWGAKGELSLKKIERLAETRL